jgi:putative phosphonate metabolism protein
MTFSRYAIYFTLPKGPLSEFGAAWLGWNAATGERPDAPLIDGLPAPAHEITATPRKYGLHGTIKPPFRLAQGQTFETLKNGFKIFCAQQSAFALDGLELTRLGRFLALTIAGDQTPLADLAANTVKALDPFRAPLTPADLERRRAANLTPRQDELLMQWGYPYVMEEFKFHLTLTGKLPKAQTLQVETALQPVLTPLLPKPFVIDALTLCGEDENGMFHELHRYTLSA